eukprot:755564-Rhodomonas_salina.1
MRQTQCHHHHHHHHHHHQAEPVRSTLRHRVSSMTNIRQRVQRSLRQVPPSQTVCHRGVSPSALRLRQCPAPSQTDVVLVSQAERDLQAETAEASV